MIRKTHKIKIKKPTKVQYTEPKPIFSNKEIIFRSGGRAKVFNISSKLQVFILILLVGIGMWSAYSYYLYNRSDKLISTKDRELVEARDALVDLMTDFVAVHRNVSSMFSQVNEEQLTDETELNRYKQQASVMEEKIRQITDSEDWIESEDIAKQVTVREALLQRDRALSERNELIRKIAILEKEETEATIVQKYVDMKTKERASITAYCKDNGFASSYGTKKSKGAGTLSGIMSEMNEKQYERGILNRFDVKTSESIQQAANASVRAIFDQLNIGGNEQYTIIQQQRDQLSSLQKKLNQVEEDLRKANCKIVELKLNKQLEESEDD
jgi:hypothetical protein